MQTEGQFVTNHIPIRFGQRGLGGQNFLSKEIPMFNSGPLKLFSEPLCEISFNFAMLLLLGKNQPIELKRPRNIRPYQNVRRQNGIPVYPILSIDDCLLFSSTVT